MGDPEQATPEEILAARQEGERHLAKLKGLPDPTLPPPPPGPIGRPTVLTPEVIDKAVTWARLSLYEREIAKKLGVCWSTWKNWKHKGRLAEEPYATFVARLDEAYVDGEAAALAAWRKGFIMDWKAAAEFLRRRWPQKWGRERVELTGAGGKPLPAPQTFNVNIDLSKLDEAELELLERMASKGVAAIQAQEQTRQVIEGEGRVVTRDTGSGDTPTNGHASSDQPAA